MFDIEDRTDQVAKIYHALPDQLRCEKLTHMASASTPSLLAIAAWPQATLHERNSGSLVGFVMPKLTDFKALHILYGPQSRRREVPDADWQFLAHVAMNCAAAFETVHRSGAVIADVNSNNLIVSPKDATVRLVDCDSFQLIAGGKRFLCEVGVPEYTPPELQGKPYSGVVRSTNHDCFGLAVLVFHLLFMGRHPFFGAFSGPGEMSQERAIQELRFAFGRTAGAKQMRPPPHSLPLAILPRALMELFENAFSEAGVRGARPTAADWLAALRSLISQLKTCANDAMHKYPAAAPGCPWCQLASSGAVFFVNQRVAITFACSASELEPLLAQLHAAMVSPAEPPAEPAGQARVPRPLPELAAKSRRQWSRSTQILIVAMLVCATAAGVALVSSTTASTVVFLCTAALLGVAKLWRVWLGNYSAFARERAVREQELRDAHVSQAHISAAAGYERRMHEEYVRDCERRAREIRGEYSRLQAEYDGELAAMTRNCHAAQRHSYLDSFEIRNGDIPGIGAGRKANLLACGFETAADVLYLDLSIVPGFGPKLQDSLRDWAIGIESTFCFDANRSLPESERRALATRFRQRQLALRGGLEQGIASARVRTEEFARSLQKRRIDAIGGAARLQQARADLEVTQKPSSRVGWVVLGVAVFWMMLVAGGVSDRRERERTPVGRAETATPSADAGIVDTFLPGTARLNAGTGAGQRFVFGEGAPRKQWMEVSLEAVRTEGAHRTELPRIAARVLVAVEASRPGSLTYQFLLQDVRVADGGRKLPVRDERLRPRLGSIAGTLLSAEVTPLGRAEDLRVVIEHASEETSRFVVEQLRVAFKWMFIELFDETSAPGARWRVRAEHLAPVPMREEQVIAAEAVSSSRVVFERTATYSSPPGAAHEPSAPARGQLTTRHEWLPWNIVPTATGTYELAVDMPATGGSSTTTTVQQFSMHPR